MPRERRSKYANDAKDTVGIASQVESLSSSLAQNMYQPINTVFNSDGTIVETYLNGMTKTTTFNSDESITEVYSAPINKTKTITFNSDGSITEVAI
jgi:hypothetical protein